MSHHCLFTLLCALLVAAPSMTQNRPVGRPFATRSVVWAKNGMAATSHPLATQVALDVLKAGGSAVDAAIAANAMLCLCEPTGCGIGGDLFAIVWDPEDKRLRGLNGSGRSPRAMTREALLAKLEELGREDIPPRGPLPVSVPGCVDGWTTMHGRYGKLPLADVLAPAIRYARQGVPVPEVIAHYWTANARVLDDYPNFAEVFLPWGRPPQPGDVFANPRLADTLEKIAEGGRDAFYEGEVARTMAGHVQRQGGFLSVEDLAAHRSEWVDPVSTTYRGHTVWELPPNGQGIAALQMLNLLEPYDVAAMGQDSAEWVHLFTEVKKLVYEDRARWYGDPAFAKVPIDELISKDYARQRGELIDLERAAREYPAGDLRLEEGDTVYLSVADGAGMMVSWIQSNYRGMGSGMVPPGLGFNLQDRGELFDLREGRPNSYAPGKRPFHTIIPAFVTKDGEPWLSFGVMGGAMQPQGHVQVLVNMIDFGMNLQEAGDGPRIRHSGSSEPTGSQMTDGGLVRLEWGFDAEVIQALRRMGHAVQVEEGGYGGYQAVLWDAVREVYAGASESRKDGLAAGY